ncbi:Siderophore synthetase component [Actinopolyspora mzabensis]|uniref:Siderophore synthetase component n=1 Tax=Actinopolyspora mzabensis TaxID=995066 RepID=A0A1G9CPY8_ACTMZ|nr:IucA/IucC family protein [Actinopolyspora mzabensis]SDK53741.1 Siderophore synthetase component [Actinopolyspora mzabensis]
MTTGVAFTGEFLPGDSDSFDADERAMLRELRAEDAELAEEWVAELPVARRDTAHHALAALLREQLLPGAVDVFRAPLSGTDEVSNVSMAHRLGLSSGAVGALRIRWCSRDGELVLVRLNGGTLVTVCSGEPPFGLHRVHGPVLFDGGVAVVELARPGQLIGVLRPEAATETEADGWRRLRNELADSARNLALSRATVRRRSTLVSLRGAGLGSTGLLPALAFRHSASEVTLELDALTAEGHNTHPCGKVRGGFSPADSTRYTAESGRVVELRFAAVWRGFVRSTPDETGRSVGELLAEHFPALAAGSRRELLRRCVEPSDYLLIPVHPWQARNVVPREYSAELASGALLLLDEPRLSCRPTLSVRTLVTDRPGRHGRRLTVKTALDVLLTSARRTIAPESTRDGPVLGTLLRKLFAEDRVLASGAGIVPDLAGVAFEPSEGGSASPGRRRGLSALLRQDPADSLHEGEQAVTAATLLAPSPVSGEPLLVELVDTMALHGHVTRAEASRWFLRDYAESLLAATLPLLSCYGIAVEAHLQNTLVVVRHSRPVRLLLRDFAGVRVHPGRLRAAGYEVPTTRPGVTSTEDPAVLRAKMCHATLQANLAEVVVLLQRSCALPGPVAWRIVREAVSAVAARVGQRGGAALTADLAALFAPELPQKALATMRLRPDQGDIYLPQPNPMSGPLPA